MRRDVAIVLAAFAALAVAPGPIRARETVDGPPVAASEDRGEGSDRSALPPAAGGPVLDLHLKEGSFGRDIPWDALDREGYLRVRDVVADAFAARDVRNITFRSRPEVLEFLLDHPDFASEVGVALRRGKYRLRRVGDAYEADDGEGARGRMWQLLREAGRRIFYVEGRYDGLLMPAFSGRLVVMLDTHHVEGPDGATYCQARFAGFVKFDSGLAAMLVRATRSLSEARVDHKVRRFFKHVAAVSRRAYDDPEGMADELEDRAGLAPELLIEFRRVLIGHAAPRWAQAGRFHLVEPALLALASLDAPDGSATTVGIEPSVAAPSAEAPADEGPNH